MVLVLLVGDAWFRFSVWLRHASIKLRARTYRHWASRLQRLSFKGDWAWLDPPCQWLRRSLRRRSNRRYRDARALRAEHGFIEERRFGLGGVWRSLAADMRASFKRSWQWIAGGSAYAMLTVAAIALLFAAHVALDAAKNYVGRIRDYTENSLGKVVTEASAAPGLVRSASAASGGSSGAAAGPAGVSLAANALHLQDIFSSLEGAVNHASQRPRLVSLLLKDQTAYLRPMMLVAEFDDELVLYDFFGDDDPEDERLFPIRTVDPANVAMILSAETSLPMPAGGLAGKSPARGLIEAACIEPGEAEAEPPAEAVAAVAKPAEAPAGPAVAASPGAAVAAEAPAIAPAPAVLRSWRDEWGGIRRTLIKGDGVNCRTAAPAPPADKPLVIEIGDRLAARLDTAAGSVDAPLKAVGSISGQLAEINVALGAVADRIATVTPGPGIDPAIAESLGRVSESLADLADAVRDRPTPPEIEAPPAASTTNYFITRIDREGATAVLRGRWDDCRDLAGWGGAGGIRFANGRFGLAGPGHNDLELGDGAADPAAAWQRLLAIFSTWSAEARTAAAGAADGKAPFVFLVGRATERGRPGLNLDLTEDRAAAVKAALLSTAALTRWGESGIEPDRIIAIGEGETALVPGEMPTDEMTRRVDAKVCFG